MERVENYSSPELEIKSIPQDNYLKSYSLVYAMCNQRPPLDHAPRLYEGHSELIEDYCNNTVLAKLKGSFNNIIKSFN